MTTDLSSETWCEWHAPARQHTTHTHTRSENNQTERQKMTQISFTSLCGRDPFVCLWDRYLDICVHFVSPFCRFCLSLVVLHLSVVVLIMFLIFLLILGLFVGILSFLFFGPFCGQWIERERCWQSLQTEAPPWPYGALAFVSGILLSNTSMNTRHIYYRHQSKK